MKLPNILTVSRIFLSPLFIIAFMFETLSSYIICFFLALIIELSDMFDGFFARRNKQTSDFGKLMDPFADSISRFSIFLCFLSADLAPLWVIAIFFYRDTLVSIIRVFSVLEGFVVSARQSAERSRPGVRQSVSGWCSSSLSSTRRNGGPGSLKYPGVTICSPRSSSLLQR